MDKAILLETISEYKTNKNANKKILISEAMKTAKNFGEPDNKGYINAVLDKILIN
jgi:transcription termination factor NusB